MDTTLILILAAAAAVFSLTAMIIAIVVLVKVNAGADSGQDLEEAIEHDLSLTKRELGDSIGRLREAMEDRMDDGYDRLGRSQREAMAALTEGVKEQMRELRESWENARRAQDERLEALRQSQDSGLKEARRAQDERLEALQSGLTKSFGELRSSQEQSFGALRESTQATLGAMRAEQSEALEKVRSVTEAKLTELKDTNQKKLDEIQGTVAEKLDKNLRAQVSDSFKTVSEQLKQVYEGLGEMKNLAGDVGSLKNALTNVKVRGEIGEIQLSRILEQTLTKEQYDENVPTKKNSGDPVEFAIKIPSKDEEGVFIYLPVDAKFPLDTYSALTEAYERGEKGAIERARAALYDRVKTDAKNIYQKYISVPETTDFGIMFLPTEGLFAEIIRNAELTERLRREWHVTVCGPSTITAFLNSLQMGFRTLTYEKKSGEIARTLGAVKTEFGKFEQALEKVQKSIQKSGADLDDLVGARTRAINRKLRGIDSLGEGEALSLLREE